MNFLPDETSGKDVVLFALAVWGAVLSTYNFLIAQKHRLKITINSLIGNGGSWIRVTAINLGSRPITVTYLTIQVPSRGTLVPGCTNLPDTPMPADLSDGKFCQTHFAYSDVAQALARAGYHGPTKIYPVATDSAGKKHRGKPWTLDPASMPR